MSSERLIFEQPPEHFDPKLEAATCFISVGDRFLFLKRHPDDFAGGLWALPGGKVEKILEESPQQAAIREVEEEVEIVLDESTVVHLQTVFVRYPHLDFIYHMFGSQLTAFPETIVLNAREHTEFQWLTLAQALELPLIPGEIECIHLVYGSDLSRAPLK